MTSGTVTKAPRARPDIRWLIWVLPVLLAAAGAVVAASWLLRAPEFIDRVTIGNRTAFDIDVDVAGPDGTVVDLTYVSAGETAVVRDVVDVGETWEFRFSYGGTDAGTLRRDRASLERSGWKVQVPQAVEDRLEAAGHEPLSRGG